MNYGAPKSNVEKQVRKAIEEAYANPRIQCRYSYLERWAKRHDVPMSYVEKLDEQMSREQAESTFYDSLV
jgi:hypothetical protein